MADRNVRIQRLTSSIDGHPPGGDPQVERVSRRVSQYFAQVMSAAAAGTSGTSTSPAPDDGEAIADYLRSDYPGAAVTAGDTCIWIINPVTGQRMLYCYDEEVVLTNEKTAAGDQAIDPPIGVRVERLMAIQPAVT